MDPKLPLSAEELEGKKRKEETAKGKEVKKQEAAQAEAAIIQVWLKSARELIKETKGITIAEHLRPTVFVIKPRLRIVSRLIAIEGGEDMEENSISRIDFTVAAFSKSSGQVLWNLSLAEFDLKSRVYAESKFCSKNFSDLAYNGTSGLHLKFSLLDSTLPSPPPALILVGLLIILIIKFIIRRKHRRVSQRKHKRVSRRKPKGLGITEDVSVGKVTILKEVIGYGSRGTTVYKGFYEGTRPVAVKRCLREHHKLAEREVDNLGISDHHPNIIRYYGVENDNTFFYLALEECHCNLHDLVCFTSNSLDSLSLYTRGVLQKVKAKADLDLWKNNKFPSPNLLQVMRDVVSGVEHLHKHGFIHRDLKPQNILLIIDGDVFCAKVADMGISKRLVGDDHALTRLTGSGSSGWRAPEQLCGDRQTRVETRAVDLFTLGLIIFYCLTKGKHPFDLGKVSLDSNIMKNQKDLFLVSDIPEAVDLLTALLDPKPELRPAAREVCNHPLFWDSSKRLAFLIDVHTCLDEEPKNYPLSSFMTAIEANAVLIFGGKSWNSKVKHILPHCESGYNWYCVRDLIRLIRNLDAHYYGFAQVVRKILGPRPIGIDRFFRRGFPNLVMEVYKVIKAYRASEDRFSIYFS